MFKNIKFAKKSFCIEKDPPDKGKEKYADSLKNQELNRSMMASNS